MLLFLGPHCFSEGSLLHSCPPSVHSLLPSMWAVSETRTCSCCCPGLELFSSHDLQDGAHTTLHNYLRTAYNRSQTHLLFFTSQAQLMLIALSGVPLSAPFQLADAFLFFKPLLWGLSSHAPAPLLPFHGALVIVL